jgi:hypothetical protein
VGLEESSRVLPIAQTLLTLTEIEVILGPDV